MRPHGEIGSYTYRGGVDADGKPHGPGVLVEDCGGAVNEGTMQHGKRHGAWVWRNQAGTAFASFECKDDKRSSDSKARPPVYNYIII